MIFSDSKILEKIQDGDIVISPFERSQLGSNSYDVRLGKNLMTYNDLILNPKVEAEVTHFEIPEDGYLLLPNRLYLGVTEEKISLKNDVGVFSGISSLARLGLTVHITACYVNVGFSGCVTLEFSVVQPMIIYPHMIIGQLHFTPIEGFVINKKNIASQYNNDENIPVKSMMFKKFEQDTITKNKYRVSDSGISFDPEKHLQ